MTGKKTTIQSTWKMNIRAWKIWWKLCPRFFFSAGISSMVKALTPYVTIFLSAQIINELSGNQDVAVLAKWVILTLTYTSLCALLNSILKHWLNYEKSSAQSIDRQVYMKKMLDLDYEDIERSRFLIYILRLFRRNIGPDGEFIKPSFFSKTGYCIFPNPWGN